MHQFDNNRFNTFGNEVDFSTLASSQRARRPHTMRKSPSEHHNHSDELNITGEEILMKKHESSAQQNIKNFESKTSHHGQNYRPKNQRQDSLESTDEAQMLFAIASRQLVGVERSLENTGKMSRGSIGEKEDLKNTLSLLFPCEYYVPESFGSTAVDNKTILEVTETEKDCIRSLETDMISKKLHDDYPKNVDRYVKKDEAHASERNHGSVRDLPKASGIISDRLTFTEYQTERTKMPEDTGRGSNTSSDKTFLMNEFKSLKKEVVAIQKDLKVSEDYNKKLEEHIYNQNNQIMHMLHNFTSMNEGKGTMKNQYSGFTSRRAPIAKEEEKVTKPPTLEKHEVVDYAVSKKANKFFVEEMSHMKSKYDKIIRNHESIIKDLQNKLKARDVELETVRKQQEEKELSRTNELILSQKKKIQSENQKGDQENYLSKESPAILNKRAGFTTPSKPNPLGEIKQMNSQERTGEGRPNKVPKGLREHDTSHNFDNSKHAEGIIKELQKSKVKDKENIPRESHGNSRLSDKRTSASKSSTHLPHSYLHSDHSNLYNKEKSGMDSQIYPQGKELVNVMSENILLMRPSNPPLKESKKIPLQNNKVFENFVTDEDLKKSFADISFDVSYLKDNNDKRMESEITSLNISPTKEQEWKYNSKQGQQAPKSKKPIHNISQFNEISIIKEQPSENFITDSIQTKIFSELQSYPDTDRKLAMEEQEAAAYQKEIQEYRTERHNKKEHDSKKHSSQGVTSKEYQKSGSEYSSRNKDHSSLPKKEANYPKDNLEQYQVNYPRKGEKKREERGMDSYKRSESSDKLGKSRTPQGQREDPLQDSRTRKEEDAYEREYREYLKELAKNSSNKHHSRGSVPSQQQQVKHEKDSRKAQSRGKERTGTGYPENRINDKYSLHHHHQQHNNNDTIVTLNKALEEILDKDTGKSGHSKQPRPQQQYPEAAKYDKIYDERERDLELEQQLQVQPRSRSSGHNRKKSGGNISNPNLQIAAPSYSSKVVASSRVEAPDSSVRRNYEKNYEGTGNKSSRKNLYVLNEDPHQNENNYSGIADQGNYLSKPRVETSKSGLGKFTTPTNNTHSHHKLPLSNMKYNSESATQLQASFGREAKSNSKSHYNLNNADSMYRNTNSFENTSGRSSAFRHNEKVNSGNSKEYKYPPNYKNYQIGPFSDISIVDYKYTEDGKSKDMKRTQPSTNDFVNFDSLLQERDAPGDPYKNDNSFALFQEKYSNTNFDSVNSSTLFDAFPIRKSQIQRDSMNTNSGQVLKLNKYF